MLPTVAAQFDDKTSQALANLLPLLACGEEAAALAFGRLGRNSRFDICIARSLNLIEAEENVHEELLTMMATLLPPPQNVQASRRAAREFHLQLLGKCPIKHLARIAAIDAAVCTIFARLTASGRPLQRDPSVIATLRGIHRDEARHVRISRMIALRHGKPMALRDSAAEAREALGKLVALGAAAFDDLMVDPEQLVRDVSCLPNGFL